jgi:hypothetical protein
MSSDERFERELRLDLRDLASEPAPERLVGRVAAIPLNTPAAKPRTSIVRVVTSLAVAAVFALLVGALVVSRPNPDSGLGGPTGQPATSPAAVPSVSPAVVQSASPRVVPSVSAAPGTLVGSAAPNSAAPPASPTVEPSSPATAAIPAGPAGGPVPAGFQDVSVSFVSADLGWVLGTATCGGTPCTSILRTSDGGRTWAAIPAPLAPISGPTPGASSGTPGTPGVSGLRFADPLNGWAFGPDLWATHDGGQTWRRLSTSFGAGNQDAVAMQVVALEAADGDVHAAFYDVASQPAVRVASSPVGSDHWTLWPARLEIGAGPVPTTQLVLHGANGWLLQVDRTVVGGLRLAGGEWTAWTPACADVAGPAALAVSSASELVAACNVGEWSTPMGEHLYVSHDGGLKFTESGVQIPLFDAAAIASPAVGQILIASGTTAKGSQIIRSIDGGATWQAVLDAGPASITYLGFTNALQGVAITAGGGEGNTDLKGSLLMTRDGGRTWSNVAFAGR